MAILRTVATFAAGYAAARLVDRMRKQGATSARKGTGKTWDTDGAEAWMKARADRFRDTYTGPSRNSSADPDAG